ncbi:MAG: HAD hydrolase family protein [Candidatus Micrarchaeota archaeon]|nr:HAD hydrolase family protein [Candidatus Micrarchaeota archaeon]MDE1859208.1 HAD hydrolase family protein [Candidatus Micrarchaeota archaeon]
MAVTTNGNGRVAVLSKPELDSLRHETPTEAIRGLARRVFVVLSDYDGTLRPYGQSEPELFGHLKKLIRDGMPSLGFGVVTARSVNDLERFSSQTEAPIIGELCGVKHDLGISKILVSKMEVEFVKEAKSMLDGFMSEMFPGHKSASKSTMLSYTRPTKTHIEVFVGSTVKFIGNKAELRGKFDAPTWTENTIDLSLKGNVKSKAVHAMAEHFNIGMSGILYMGNGENDIAAFVETVSHGGVAVAPANASGALKKLIAKDETGRMILHHLESTECVHDVITTLHAYRYSNSERRQTQAPSR